MFICLLALGIRFLKKKRNCSLILYCSPVSTQEAKYCVLQVAKTPTSVFAGFKASIASSAPPVPSAHPSNIAGGANTSSNIFGSKPTECMFIILYFISSNLYTVSKQNPSFWKHNLYLAFKIIGSL